MEFEDGRGVLYLEIINQDAGIPTGFIFVKLYCYEFVFFRFFLLSLLLRLELLLQCRHRIDQIHSLLTFQLLCIARELGPLIFFVLYFFCLLIFLLLAPLHVLHSHFHAAFI